MKPTIPSFITLAGLALAGASLNAQAVIYEGFADSNPSLRDNTTGTGLTGNWGGDTRPVVEAPTLSFGSLQTSGNQVSANGSWFPNNASIDATAASSLLADGSELWFSMLYRIDTTSTGRFYFTISADTLTVNGDTSTTNGGAAIGFGSTGSQVWAGLWTDGDWGATNLSGPAKTSVDINGDNNVTSADAGSISTQTTYLIVGHAQWGATASDTDIVDLYLPGTDLVLGSRVASSEGIIDQTIFNLINTNHGNNLESTWDEIRVGASYNDVAPVPEPGSFALIAGFLGLSWVMLRRRACSTRIYK